MNEITTVDLVGFHERTMATMRALFADDTAALRRVKALLEGAQDDSGLAILDLRDAIDQAIKERDRARYAAARLSRIDPKSVTLALLRGRA